jgi:acyl-CoA synthetase (AMP-forming)/AMP-acid ligase II
LIQQSPFPAIPIPEGTLTDWVFAQAASYGDRAALVDAVSGQAISYADLVDRVRRLAAGLSRRGVGKGTVVAIWAPNVPEFAIVFHAVLRLGATLTTANPAYTNEELAGQLTHAGAVELFTTAALFDRASEVVRQAARPIGIVAIDPRPGAPSLESISVDADPPAVHIDPDQDVAVLPFSSGTTGLPKGVMLTHRNLLANAAQIDAIETTPFSALLAVLPFFHIYAMMIILTVGLKRGATIVTLPRFDLETVLRVLQEWPIQIGHIVPPLAVALAKHPIVDRYQFPHLKVLFSGAAPLGPELTAAVEQRLAVRVCQGYGMTEASPATHYTVAGRERPGKAGELMPSTECCVVDPESGAVVGRGQRGEVWVRGPQVMKGYLNDPDATARTVDADGWLHTGDIGIVDEDGYLEIVDRLKELIKVKGFQVAPAELEALLLTHPKIADVAVIPVPDADCGEVPKAIVVAREPLTAEEVIAFVEGHVAHYKRIRSVGFVDQIPKSPSGKILRRILVARERAS